MDLSILFKRGCLDDISVYRYCCRSVNEKNQCRDEKDNNKESCSDAFGSSVGSMEGKKLRSLQYRNNKLGPARHFSTILAAKNVKDGG